jgi:hypothetical protein
MATNDNLSSDLFYLFYNNGELTGVADYNTAAGTCNAYAHTPDIEVIIEADFMQVIDTERPDRWLLFEKV